MTDGRLLGIDHGTRRIGLAISDPTRTIASALPFVPADAGAIDKIIEIARRNDCEYLVVGIPHPSNSPVQRKKIEKFALELEKKSGLRVVLELEDMSSMRAEEAMLSADMSREKRKKKIDSAAAAIILQRHLDSLALKKNGRL